MFDLHDLGVTEPGGDPLLDLLADLTAHRLGADVAALSLFDAARDEFVVRRAGDGVADFLRTPAEGAPCAEVISTGRTVALSGACADDPRFSRLREMGFSAYLGHPVLGPAEDTVGSAVLLSRRPRIWGAEERRVLAGVAALASTRLLLAAALETVSHMGRELAVLRRPLRPR
jgi:GAF domain-containing protein